MQYKVLITTSGVGSRLGDLTDFTNKALVRIGDRPALSHIIEGYPADTEFVITLGHHGLYVKEFVEMAYPQLNCIFVWVDNYSGPGSSLAYSILQAKEDLQCPFIFNACDTFFKDNSVLLECTKTVQNFCIGERKKDASQYSTLLIEANNVIKIKEKGEINYDFAYVGLCGIKDYILFWKELEGLYGARRSSLSLFEGNVINRMLELPTTQFKFFKSDNWLDIGNVGELEKARQHFPMTADVLEKKDESDLFFRRLHYKVFCRRRS